MTLSDLIHYGGPVSSSALLAKADFPTESRSGPGANVMNGVAPRPIRKITDPVVGHAFGKPCGIQHRAEPRGVLPGVKHKRGRRGYAGVWKRRVDQACRRTDFVNYHSLSRRFQLRSVAKILLQLPATVGADIGSLGRKRGTQNHRRQEKIRENLQVGLRVVCSAQKVAAESFYNLAVLKFR
jgi:hypothetical protein